ncbi:MAG: AMP-binding protein [Verrucomicrobia bacterium]|jgi:acyl-CoA synthetase (AMP-forming)/AMP-acid ligase II|nr:AMP-binding protein [Verrucomicrobiota bacterium]
MPRQLIPDVDNERPFLIGGGETWTYGQLWARVEAMGADERERPLEACRIIDLRWEMEPLARLLACFTAGRDLSLCGPVEAATRASFRGRGFGPLLLLRSGGTTGTPRTVVHAQRRFLADYRPRPGEPRRELILYAPDHVAGLDAFMRGLSRGVTLVRPESATPAAIAEALEAHRVEVLPATPSFLQFLLLSGELAGRDLSTVRHIPHGAEPMPASVRAAVKAWFPKARLHHRFGLTETGVLPVEADPEQPEVLRLPDHDDHGYAWRVVDGELWVRSPRRMLGTLEDGLLDTDDLWYRTGDRAEKVPGGGVRVLGRESAQINVGGEKVQPEEVEAWLLEVDGIRDVEVRAAPHSLTGQTVVARVVLEEGANAVDLRSRVRKAARTAARPLVQIPAKFEHVDAIERTDTGKRVRG